VPKAHEFVDESSGTAWNAEHNVFFVPFYGFVFLNFKKDPASNFRIVKTFMAAIKVS
jgi:hypothetical protein